jgi:hypothetical protein
MPRSSIESITLDLEKDPLYGWEYAKDGMRLGNLVRAIERDEAVRPVTVFEYQGDYYLDNRVIDPEHPHVHDGGHHRALAHLLAEVPLKAMLSQAPGSRIPYEPIPVHEFKVVTADEMQDAEDAYILQTFVEGGR